MQGLTTTCMQAVLETLKSGSLDAPALGPPEAAPWESAMGLDALPESISDMHYGMPEHLHEAPMRFLLLRTIIAWDQLRVYEEVAPSECVDTPYQDVTEEDWKSTAVLSWRWALQKPNSYQQHFSPMSGAQYAELQGLLRHLAQQGTERVWIDWCCVPQYSGDTMVEVLRSKVGCFVLCINGYHVETLMQEQKRGDDFNLMKRKHMRVKPGWCVDISFRCNKLTGNVP